MSPTRSMPRAVVLVTGITVASFACSSGDDAGPTSQGPTSSAAATTELPATTEPPATTAASPSTQGTSTVAPATTLVATTATVPPTTSATGVTLPADGILAACGIDDAESGGLILPMCVVDPESKEVIAVGRRYSLAVGGSWSPDRARFAFVCGYERSSAHQIWPTGDAVDFGPTGFTRNQGGEICIGELDGSARVVTDTDARANAPAWSPNGNLLAFALTGGQVVVGGGTTSPAPVLGAGLYVMTAAGMDRITDGDRDDFPAWSPDGTKLAFSSDFDIAVAAPDGSGKVMLTSGPDIELGPQWSPDGQQLAFLRFPLGDAAPQIWVMAADGSDQRLLYQYPDSLPDPNIGFDLTPAWSPDGTMIAAGVAAAGGAGMEVRVFSVASGDSVVVSPTAGADELGSFQPSWSPDGERLAFSSDHLAATFELVLVRPDGSGLEVLDVTDNEVFDPAWS